MLYSNQSPGIKLLYKHPMFWQSTNMCTSTVKKLFLLSFLVLKRFAFLNLLIYLFIIVSYSGVL